MQYDVTLTQDELRKLKNDEAVVKHDHGNEIHISPPCGIDSHEWMRASLGPEEELRRKCKNCDIIQTTSIDIEEQFNSP